MNACGNCDQKHATRCTFREKEKNLDPKTSQRASADFARVPPSLDISAVVLDQTGWLELRDVTVKGKIRGKTSLMAWRTVRLFFCRVHSYDSVPSNAFDACFSLLICSPTVEHLRSFDGHQ